MKGDRPRRPAHPGPPDSLWKLVQSCWRDAAIDRPEIEVVVEELKGMSVRFFSVHRTNSHLCPLVDSRKIIQPAGMRSPSEIVRDEWGAPDASSRPNVDEHEEVNPYDVDTPLTSPAPASPPLSPPSDVDRTFTHSFTCQNSM